MEWKLDDSRPIWMQLEEQLTRRIDVYKRQVIDTALFTYIVTIQSHEMSKSR